MNIRFLLIEDGGLEIDVFDKRVEFGIKVDGFLVADWLSFLFDCQPDELKESLNLS